jgi:hypothetical protein
MASAGIVLAQRPVEGCRRTCEVTSGGREERRRTCANGQDPRRRGDPCGLLEGGHDRGAPLHVAERDGRLDLVAGKLEAPRVSNGDPRSQLGGGRQVDVRLRPFAA